MRKGLGHGSTLLLLAGLSLSACGEPTPEYRRANPGGAKAATGTIELPAEKNPDIDMDQPEDFILSRAMEDSLLPLDQGNYWSYVVETNATNLKTKQNMAGTLELTYLVQKAIHEKEGVDRYIIDILQNGKKQDEQEWIRQPEGIFMLSSKKERLKFSPRQPILMFPVKIEGTFEWTGEGVGPRGTPARMKYRYAYGDLQDADVEGGSMRSLFVNSLGTFYDYESKTDGTLGTNGWFRPGVGMVRYKQLSIFKGVESSLVLRLSDYRVKKI
jgi:hypothetical protein